MAYRDEGLELYEYYKPIVTGTPPSSSYVTRKEQETQIRRVKPQDLNVVFRIKAEQVKAKAIELKQQGKHIEAGFYASAYMGLSVGEGVGGTFVGMSRLVTDPVGVLGDIGYVATHLRPTLGAIGMAIAEDPVRVVGQVGGGILVGAAVSDVIAKVRGPKTVKTVETKTVRKPRLSRGFSRTSFEPKKVVVHTDDFLGSHQVPTGGSWPKSGRTGLGKPHYLQTGEGLMETIPYSGGVEQTVYKLTTRVTRRPTQLRGAYAVTRTVTTQIPRTPSMVPPLLGAVAPFSPYVPGPPIKYPDIVQRGLNVYETREKPGIGQTLLERDKLKDYIVGGPVPKYKTEPITISSPVSRTRQELGTILPGYTPAPQKIRPISRTRITPVPLPPGYTQKLIPVSIQVPRSMPIQIQRTKTTPRQRGRTPTPFYIPQIRHISLTAPPPTERRPRRKKRAHDSLKLDIWGELRGYPVKTPEAVLRSMRI